MTTPDTNTNTVPNTNQAAHQTGAPIDRRTFIAQAAGGVAAMAVLPDLALARQPGAGAGVRVALIGAGRQGRSIMGEILKIDGAALTALCEIDERRLASGLRRSGGADGYGSIDELMGAADTFDAVIVATPTPTHRAVAERVLDSGKHLYLECPLAHTLEDCAAIAQAARGSSAVLAAGLHARANPVYQLARGFFLSDSVRDLISMRAQHHHKTTWRVPSRDPRREKQVNWRLDPEVTTGLAGEWGTHQFDVFHWYTGRYPTSVLGTGSIRVHDDGREVNDTISCLLEWQDGATANYSATLCNSYEDRYEVLYGSNAAIKLAWSHGWMFKEADAPTQGWEVYANRQQFFNDEGITLIAGATQLAEQGKLKDGVGLPHSSLWYALADWLGAITESGRPATSIAEGARASAVGIAAHRATVSGERVDVDLSGL